MEQKVLQHGVFGSTIFLIIIIVLSLVIVNPGAVTEAEAGGSEVATVVSEQPEKIDQIDVTPTPSMTAMNHELTQTPVPTEMPEKVPFLCSVLSVEENRLPEFSGYRQIIIRRTEEMSSAVVSIEADYSNRRVSLILEDCNKLDRAALEIIRVEGEELWVSVMPDMEEYTAIQEAENSTEEAGNDAEKAGDGEGKAVDNIEEAESGEEEAKNDGTRKDGTETLGDIEDVDEGRQDFVLAMDTASGEAGESIAFLLDKTSEYNVYEDEEYYYIDCIRPKDIYDRIVVIDAGHGGKDPGSDEAGEGNYEKSFNLNILLYLKELFDGQSDIKVYYTRVDDTYVGLSRRIGLANDIEADLFVSIHNNSAKSSYISGSEVLYSQWQNDWDTFNSKQFAKICLEEINELFPVVNRGIVPRAGDVLVLGSSTMPSALVEAAYLTNKSNLDALCMEENQKAIAQGIYNAILRAYSVMANEKQARLR